MYIVFLYSSGVGMALHSLFIDIIGHFFFRLFKLVLLILLP